MADRQPVGVRRTGYVAAAIVNLVLLWAANHLLEWEWPPFLTRAYEDLLPWIQVSLGATVAANVLWTLHDPAWSRHIGEAALDVISVVVAIRTWQLFPFDFTEYSDIWEVGARVLIVVAGVGAVIGVVAELGRAIGSAVPRGRGIGRRPRTA
ncbi:MAG TPA: hypothetical protein VFU14_20115 [Acidimicrobiales bacterium]|nr:hypothetical protein [Acidimicrobiales bacterium]